MEAFAGLGLPTTDPTSMSVAAVEMRVMNALAGNTTGEAASRALGESAATVADAASSSGAEAADATMQAMQAEQQSLMTPERALDTIADHAGDMDKMQDDSEFVLRLEPEHLGPLIIRISTRNGRIRAQLITANDQATTALASGQLGLQDRLAALGFAVADVEVRRRDAHDDAEIRRRFGNDG
jgi:flagellar hook-length control protein FliK